MVHRMALNESPAKVPDDGRLRMLASASAGLGDIEVLQCALDQAVAALGALGGTVHWCVPGRREPRLALTSGLPRAALQAWEGLRDVVTRAQHEDVLVHMPVARSTDTQARPGAATPSSTMTTAVPLRDSKTTFGVLSVLTDGPAEPAADHQEFLHALALWLADRLSLSSPDSGVRREWWQERSTGSRLQQALKAVRVGSWEWDIRTGELFWDESALALLGIAPGTGPYDIDTLVRLIHPEDLPRATATTQEALRTRSMCEVEYRVCRPDGTIGWIQTRGRLALDDDGRPIRMVGTVWDTTESRVAQDSVGRALRDMTDAFLAVNDEWRITFVNLGAENLLASAERLHGRLLWEVFEDKLPGLQDRCRRAVAENSPVGFDVQWPADRRWYHVRLVPVPDGLTLYLTDVTERRMREVERVAAGRAAAERTAWIQELTRALGEAVSVADVVRAIAERVLPSFGANGLVMLTLENDRMHVIGAAGHARDLLTPGDEGYLPVDGSLLTDAFGAHAPIFIDSKGEYLERYPDLARLTAGSGMEAWALLPLSAPGRSRDCCVISFARSRMLGGEEHTMLAAVGGLIAQALARARLYDAEHVRAQELQRLLLPRDLPTVPAVTAAARYLPASSTRVGGDWYDIIPLSAERVALVIGDVMGHGLNEAATMGRLRTAVRTLADLELSPEDLFAHLNDLVTDLGEDIYVTCLYAVYDPASGVCTIVNAGHPPPVVVHPDGTVHIPQTVPDPPLGAAEPPFDTFELQLPEDSLLVLYTDGLIQSATHDVDQGLADLVRLLEKGSSRAGGDLDGLCEAITTAMLPTDRPTVDDTALLIAGTSRLASEDVASWSLPDDPMAARQARRHVREQLAAWDLEDLVTTTELVASELVGNVIRHARGPARLRLLRSRTLICEVSDGSLTTPRIRRATDTDEGGRGLQLIAALSQRWGARYTAEGKWIWTEQALSGSDATLEDMISFPVIAL